MTKSEKVKHWTDGAERGLKAARALLANDCLLECGFFCHLTAEKALKAVIANRGETPLPIHGLLILAEEGHIDEKLSDEHRALLESLKTLNILGRYPGYKNQIADTLTPNKCEKLIDETEVFLCWIKTLL